MQQWDFQERRRLARYEITLAARETDSPSHPETASTTRDICGQGIGLISSERLPLQTPIEISLFMPDDQQKIIVRGKVVWQTMEGPNKFRSGVQLEALCLEPIPLVLRMIKLHLRNRYSG